MAVADIKLNERVKVTTKLPSMWKVVFLNDDKTSIEFVVAVLMSIFNHSRESAEQLALKIHNSGSGVAGVYSHEIAEQKAIDTKDFAKANGFPLRVEVHPDK